MKKLGKAIQLRDPQPVIAVRVPSSLHRRIKVAAKRSGRTMSDEMAHLLALGFEMQSAFGDRLQIIREANAQAARIQRSALETTLRQANWRRLHGTPYWIPPEAHGLPPNGFDDNPQADETVTSPPIPQAAIKRTAP